MRRYRKKPVEVEAEQYQNGILSLWMQDALCHKDDGHVGAHIHTLEGTMWVRPGDWIIKGIVGECYPCKPAIFAATYEEAE